MTTQPEALRLADKMSSHNLIGATALKKTADELRRLHEVEKHREDLLVVLKDTAEALAHCMGNEYAPVVEARAAIAKATEGAA